LNPQLAAQELIQNIEKFDINGTALIQIYDSIAQRDEAAAIHLAMSAPAKYRNLMQSFTGIFSPTEANQAAMNQALPEAAATVQSSYFRSQLYHDATALDLLKQLPGLPNETSQSIALETAMVAVSSGRTDAPLADLTTILNLSSTMTKPVMEVDDFIGKNAEFTYHETVGSLIASQWPESQQLLQTLTPAAQERFLPELANGIVLRDPAMAIQLVAAHGGWTERADLAASFAETWSAQDPAAALKWAQTLSGPAKEKALTIAQKAQAGWDAH
jgi:hypothetical protein